MACIAAWVLFNVLFKPFEPYPMIIFGALGAVLATVAACQGPLILLTQRRAAMRDRDRDRETHTVAVNAEADLHELKDTLAQLVDQVAALSARGATDAGALGLGEATDRSAPG